MENKITEIHPLRPFLPEGARMLMLGSFPPPRERWSMDFYYPNLQNDMWRIFGLVFFGNKDHFLEPGGKAFSRDNLIAFLTAKGIALSDTALSVVRHKSNASDKFLEVTEKRDITSLLSGLAQCTSVVTTGQKATDTLLESTGGKEPLIGNYAVFTIGGREYRHYRMPSSSRAYPRSLQAKAEDYAKMFRQEGIL